jgi:CYTH domain-containing protein
MTNPETTQTNPEKSPVEVERKFLVNALPGNLHEYKHEAIRQGYLVIGEDGSEARLRDRDGAYTLTVKSKGELSRGEWEAPISAEQFATWWPATNGKRVEKTRYSIPFDEHVVELDIYAGDLSGLVTAEVEFAHETSAYAFQQPDWLSVDVTSDKAYKNQQLALKGLPR